MSIASRIEAIEQHLTDDYNVLEVAGADLTNVNKNILNLKSTWQERLLYFMNNGTDVVWNNWDKVTGEGTSISLNNTLEGKMKIDLKGNTSQDSTTGKNLFDISKVKSSTGVVNNNNGTLTITSTSSSTSVAGNDPKKLSDYCPTLQVGDVVYLNANTTATQTGNDRIYLLGSKVSWYFGTSRTITQEDLNSNVYWYANGLSTTATISNIMVSTTGGEYEPYTNGASPNPNYPQDIHVVSGDNSIVVSNNINNKGIRLGLYQIANGEYASPTSGNRYATFNDLLEVQPNTTYKVTTTNNINAQFYQLQYNESKTYLSNSSSVQSVKDYTFTTGATTKYLAIDIRAYDMTNITTDYVGGIEVIDTKASYPITLPEGMFLGWIPNTDYRDKIDKSSGKNLFDKDSQDILENVRIGADGGNNADSGYFISEFIEVTPNTKYTKNTTADAYHRFAFYTDKSTNSFISKSEDNTITTPSNAKYLRLCGLITELDNVMLNEGTTALPYEPYGTSWYVKKEIGKVVLNGSENWSDFSVGDTNFRCQYDVALPNILTPPTNPAQLFSNYFKAINRDNAYAKTEIGIAQYGSTLGKVFICAPNNILSGQTLASWKNWLSTHNTIVYYVLATPTYTPIEDTTLISQLETIKKSYASQTNISQTNNDLPFIINATALKEMA